MAVTTVRPSGVTSGASAFTVTGAANAYAATSDNSDASYIRKTGTGNAAIIFGFGGTTLGASQRVRQVRLRARIQAPTSSGKLNLQLGSRIGGVNYFHSAYAVRGAVATGEVVGQWYSTAPDGSEWTQSAISALRAQVTEYRDTTDRSYVYELYIDVDIANQATVTVSAPTGTITATAKPDVTWSVTDPDGDAASYYQVKVFDSATYGAAGFDPSTASATWDSTQVPSGDVSTTVGTYLSNGAYRAYVRSGKSINGVAFFSGWAYSSFTISLSPPTVPTLATSYDSAQNRVLLTATGAAPTGFASQAYDFEKSTDSGVTWSSVRFGLALAPNASYVASIYDNEPTRGLTMRYRVRSVGTSGTNVQASAWSASSTVAVASAVSWILKTLEPAPQVATDVRIIGPNSWDRVEQLGTFRPLGRSYPIVTASALGGRDGTLEIITIGAAEYASVSALLNYQGTLFVQSPFGDDFYLRITSRSVVRDGGADNPRNRFSCGYVEVQG